MIQQCTAALFLEINPVALVCGRENAGQSRAVCKRPALRRELVRELAETVSPLVAELPVVGAEGGADLVRRWFAPLGCQVEAQGGLLDETFPE